MPLCVICHTYSSCTVCVIYCSVHCFHVSIFSPTFDFSSGAFIFNIQLLSFFFFLWNTLFLYADAVQQHKLLLHQLICLLEDSGLNAFNDNIFVFCHVYTGWFYFPSSSCSCFCDSLSCSFICNCCFITTLIF